MMYTFEYVATGIGHTYLMSNMFMKNPEVVDFVNDTFSKLNGRNNSKFSLLFNAYTEAKYGGHLNRLYRSGVHQFHSDSGGLQIVTLGKKITPELRHDVYKVQAKYSDVAMSFDEIPVVNAGDKSTMGQTSGRFFDKNNVIQMAKLSGQNVHDQINTFLDEKSKTKPYIIAHGNCRETYLQWLDIIYQEIPSHLHQYVGGIAVSGVALGAGLLEDIQKAFYTKDFLEYNSNIHILGVGAIARMLPYLTLISSDFYKKDMHLSYDSTSQTAGIARVALYEQGKEIKHGKKLHYIYDQLYDKVNEIVDLKAAGVSHETFFEIMNKKCTKRLLNSSDEFDLEKVMEFAHVVIGWLAYSVNDITSLVDKLSKSTEETIAYAHGKGWARDMSPLSNINDLKTFEEW